MTLLVDWSQLTIATTFAFQGDFVKGADTKKMVDIIRHVALSTLLSHKQKFSSKYPGDVVIAVDDREYWRRNYFPNYKGMRKKNRAESNVDWKSIFEISSQLKSEFKEVFPYRFVQAAGAEADDVIGVLCKWWQDNELNETVFQSDPKEVLIISNDGDFGQLHKYKNVRQWNPITKKLVDKAPKHFLLEKVIQGDSGDGIPNVKSPDNALMDGIRQSPITAKLKEAAVNKFINGEPITFGNAEMDRNYIRNRNLIDFDFIPVEITNRVIEAYLNSEPINRSQSKIFNYFIEHRCKQLMDRITQF